MFNAELSATMGPSQSARSTLSPREVVDEVIYTIDPAASTSGSWRAEAASRRYEPALEVVPVRFSM